MCEINPKHKKVLRLEFFTSIPMSAEAFETQVTQWVLLFEMSANRTGELRCHIHEMEEPKDG